MDPEYTLAYDATTATLPLLPLVLVLGLALLFWGIIAVAKKRLGEASLALKLTLLGIYLTYAPAVAHGYWTVWHERADARAGANAAVEVGRLDDSWGRSEPAWVFVTAHQHFAVNGVAFDFRQRNLRYLDFILPGAEPVPLPLYIRAHVRITYLAAGENRTLLKFEIATNDIDDQSS